MCAKYLARRVRAATAMLAVASAGSPVAAQVVLDGTTGPAGVVAGRPDYAIGAELGRRAGPNLYHSFERFGLRTGERATFSGPDDIANVISRVTGGEHSDIDGTLRSTIPGADFWFLNPAGVVFGPNARLDLQGSFHVSTADELRFAGGARFSAADPTVSSFTVAPPEAFGFLGTEPAGLMVDRSRLSVPLGEALSLVGGDITITADNNDEASEGEDGTVRAEAGRITLAALGGPGVAPVAGGKVRADALADIRLTDQALVDASGDGGGTVRIRGGRLVVENRSFVFADNTGATHGSGGIGIEAEAVTIGTGAAVTVDALGSGDADRLSIRAGELLVTDGGFAGSLATADGRAGDVAIEVTGETEVRDGGFIRSDTRGGGAAGVVTVLGGDLTMRGGGFIRSSAFANGDAGAVAVEAGRLTITRAGSDRVTGILSNAEEGSGTAGAVAVTADTLEIRDGGEIGSGTFAAGDAGPVTVEAGRLTMAGDGSRFFTGIASQTSSGSRGNASRVAVTAGALAIQDRGAIGSSTRGAGNAGAVAVEAARLRIMGGGSRFFTGIASQANSGSSGNAGAVAVTAGALAIRHSGEISSGTSGPGDAGSVAVEAGRLRVVGGSRFFTGIASRANAGSTGAAGAVTVRAGDLELRDGGQISGTTLGEGRGGDVRIEVDRLLITRAGSNRITGILSSAQGGPTAHGGTLTVVVAGQLEIRDGGGISGSTFGPGDAGAVAVEAGRLTIAREGSEFVTGIASDATATHTPDGHLIGATGNAGPVTVRAGNLELRVGVISSSTLGAGNAGTVTVEVGQRLLIVGDDSRFFTGIASDAAAASAADGQTIVATGKAGAVTVRAGDLELRDGGQISSSTVGPGDAGMVAVEAGRLRIAGVNAAGVNAGIASQANPGSSGNAGSVLVAAPVVLLADEGTISSLNNGAGRGGNVVIHASDTLRGSGGRITAETAQADAGDVTIVAGRLVDLVDSAIATSAAGGTGGGGNILIDPRFVVLDRSAIVADAVRGGGGDITINAGTYIQSADSLVRASSALGLPGTVTINAPDSDIGGGLVALEAAFLDASARLPESCAARRAEDFSSFTAAGRGGLPPGPDAPLPGFYALSQAAPAMGAASPLSVPAAPSPPLRLTGLEIACGGGR